MNEAAGIQLTTGGQDFGGSKDEGQFYYRGAAGDFDVRVRVVSLAGGDLWAKAGIMARLSLEPGSPAIAVLATPSLVGCLMTSRADASGTATSRGAFPPAFPQMWLRLQRTNDVFNGYAGVDGRRWYPLGSTTVPLDQTLLLGLAASSHASNTLARAVFTDFGEVAGATVAATPLHAEYPGPSSRKTGLAITEIMYHPPERADGKNLEFIEVFNSNPFFEDISGYRLTGDIDFTFPKNTVLPGGGFVVVAKAPADVQSVYGLEQVLGPYGQKLPSSGVVRLRNPAGAVLLEVAYANQAPWPIAATGAGHSLVLSRPSYGEANAEAWDASYAKGGSPGRADPPRAGAWHEVVLNEYHGAAGQGDAGFLELFNRANQPLDISGGYLSDDPATNKFRIPAGTLIGGRGYAVFRAEQLGFPLTSAGAALYLSDPEKTRVIQATRFAAHLPGASLGCWPDGGGEIYSLAATTPGAANREPAAAPVVINEIMYHPISENDDDQYVELFNPGAEGVDLSGWRFVDGIDFTFPQGTAITAGGYLVVARNAARLKANYPKLTSANTVGDFQGKLAHGGERLALSRPVVVAAPDAGITQTAYAVVDETTYRAGGRWGQWANGGGSSLELIDARADRRRASNWADSDETKKAPWTTVEYTGLLNYGYVKADSLHVLLLGAGECLVDNVELLLEGNPTNLVVNPNFEKGLTSWTILGDHVRSTLETGEGYQSAQSLHVRASNNGDTGANRIRGQLANTPQLVAASPATLRAKVRWLHGWPEILLRIKGNYLEAYGRLEVPRDLGTPGAPNSRAVANAGPAVDAVSHYPPVPAVNQPVLVTARVTDPDGIAAVTLRYRLDPATNYEQLAMVDDGIGGDAAAGDGIYSAMIPGQPAGKLVAFHVEALDRSGSPARTLFPGDAPAHECLVRFGDAIVNSGFGSYRMWLTAATLASWTGRPVLSNEELDITFVYGNQRVVYNASARYSGSPFHQGSYSSPTGGICTYAMSVPGDDQVLGATSFNKLHAPGNTPGDDSTLQCEQAAYWMVRQMGLPWNYQRYVHMYVNGVKRGPLMEDTQVPGTDVLKENFPDDADGNLYKLSGYIEYADAKIGSMSQQSLEWCSLDPAYTPDGLPNLAGYRWTWATRAANGTANDYTNVIALTEAANNTSASAYQPGLEALVDVDQWLRTLAIEHVVGNWDSFGFQSGQNMFAYKPTKGKWCLIIWDFNIVLANSNTRPASQNNLLEFANGSGMMRLGSYPPFTRAYLRAVKAIAEGPAMDSSLLGAVLDARYAAFKAVGLSAGSPASIKSYVTARRNTLLKVLATYDAGFKLTGRTAGDFTTNQNWFTLTGTAGLDTESILINGTAYPVTWLSATNWSVRLPLSARASSFIVRGADLQGAPLPGAAAALTVTYTGPLEPPDGQVVINEVMYHPAQAGTEFVELYNTSTRAAFDLSKYRFSGIEFTFPDGAWIDPGGYLVVVHNRAAFTAAYGPLINVAGEFAGHLDNQGGALRLIRPGPNALADKVVEEALYSSQFPWPQAANGQGGSLQLLDPAQDRRHPNNWGAALPAGTGPAAWRFVSVTGVAPSSNANLLVYHSPYQPPRASADISGTWKGTIDFPGQPFDMTVAFAAQNNAWTGQFVVTDGNAPLTNIVVSANSVRFEFPPSPGTEVRWEGTLSPDGHSIQGVFHEVYQVTNTLTADFLLRHVNDQGRPDGGDVYLDELALVAGTVPGAGANLLRNGGFEDPLTNGWRVASNHLASSVGATNIHAGLGSLHLVASSGGRDEDSAVWQTVASLAPGQTYTLSYWYLPSTNGVDLTVRLGDGDLASTQRILPEKAATPGAPNAIWSHGGTLLPLGLTEVLPENLDGVQDARGHRAPWVELHNTSSNTVPLAGCYLAAQTTNLTQWAFPAEASLAPGQYRLVWLDAAPDESTPAEWHANFRAAPGSGAVILSHYQNGTATVLDGLYYRDLTSGQSFGLLPDGQKAVQSQATPGQPNQSPPVVNRLLINEWMAGNARTLADPADGRFKDWFELFNPTDEAVDLTGYSLSDSLTNRLESVIPAGRVLAPHGYFIVWADGLPPLNGAASTALHTAFKLSQDGDTIALFAPDGRLVDAVTFGRQTPDISQGRNDQGALAYMNTPTPGMPTSFPGFRRRCSSGSPMW